MSDEIDETALFDQLADQKGDRLAELNGIADDNSDDTATDTGEGDGAAPAATAATPTETAPAAPAAGQTTTTTSAQPAPEAAAAPVAAAPTTDIWANAPAELRDAHARALAQADQKYRSDIGRQAAFQRRIQVLEAENEALRRPKTDAAATGTAAPTTTDTPAATADAAPAAQAGRKSLLDAPEVRRAREDYPEVAEPFAQIIETLEGRLDAIDRDVGLTREERAQAATDAQEAALNAAHPDWRQACGSKDFADWLNVQPKAIKDIIARNGEQVVDAEEAIAMVSSFKAHYALTHPTPQPQPQQQQTQQQPAATQPSSLQQRRQAQLRAVTTAPSGGTTPMPDGPQTDDGTGALFQHFAARKTG